MGEDGELAAGEDDQAVRAGERARVALRRRAAFEHDVARLGCGSDAGPERGVDLIDRRCRRDPLGLGLQAVTRAVVAAPRILDARATRLGAVQELRTVVFLAAAAVIGARTVGERVGPLELDDRRRARSDRRRAPAWRARRWL